MGLADQEHREPTHDKHGIATKVLIRLTWLESMIFRPLVMRTSDSALLMRFLRADVSGDSVTESAVTMSAAHTAQAI